MTAPGKPGLSAAPIIHDYNGIYADSEKGTVFGAQALDKAPSLPELGAARGAGKRPTKAGKLGPGPAKRGRSEAFPKVDKKASETPEEITTIASQKARPPRRPALPGPPIADEATLSAATEALRARDPELVEMLIAVGGRPPLRLREPGFAGLAAIVVSQQLSTASAAAILGRLEAAIEPLDAAGIAAASDDTLRACGLSTAKIGTLRAASEAVAAGFDLAGLAAIDAGRAHDALVALKGVGAWTADLYLLFCLGHPDAFPSGDLALQEAARLALGLETRPDAAKLEAIAERWRPHRGVAARMLWAYYRARKARSGMVLADASR